MTPLSSFDPARCLRTAAARLHSIQILRSEKPPVHPEGKAALASYLLSMEIDARTYLRLAVLAGRDRTAKGRRFQRRRGTSTTCEVPLGPPSENGQRWSLIVPQWPAR